MSIDKSSLSLELTNRGASSVQIFLEPLGEDVVLSVGGRTEVVSQHLVGRGVRIKVQDALLVLWSEPVGDIEFRSHHDPDGREIRLPESKSIATRLMAWFRSHLR